MLTTCRQRWKTKNSLKKDKKGHAKPVPYACAEAVPMCGRTQSGSLRAPVIPRTDLIAEDVLLVDLAARSLKIAYTAVDGKPEIACKLLKELVGERGFEPPTPWSRTRFKDLLKAVGICCF
jgi:hypothetical protein